MFRDAGFLNCSMQMGFISSLELTLECSQPICLVGDQLRAHGAVSDTAFSEDFPWKTRNYRVASRSSRWTGLWLQLQSAGL